MPELAAGGALDGARDGARDAELKLDRHLLFRLLGQIDIYLLDQLMKDRIRPGMRVLDAGCGGGRNLVALLRMHCQVCAVDRDASSVAMAGALIEQLTEGRAQGGRSEALVAPLDALPLADADFDAVICSAVLHFADNEAHFERMVAELWRVLAPGGLLFTRLASSIGIEERIHPLGKQADRRFTLPDGSQRFLVDEALLLDLGARLGGQLLDPIKTTNVQGLRCMTTWCLAKPAH